MEEEFSSVFDFVKELKQYIQYNNISQQFLVYSNYKEHGCLLLKNNANNNINIFKPWDSDIEIGKIKIENFISNTLKFKGHAIDTYILIGKKFRDISKQFARVDNKMVIIEISLEKRQIYVYGSMHLETVLLDTLIQFTESINFEITYDFKGMLKHKGFNSGVLQVEKIETKQDIPKKVFISYSWDDQSHRTWVLKLSADLIRNGIDVIVDEWDLEKYRNDLHLFMETGIRESDFVIIVCTPNYAKKTDTRIGGVGVENTIITGEFYDEDKGSKYIPIVRNYTSTFSEALPTYLRTKFFVDFKESNKYNEKLEHLIRMILNKPMYKRPERGNIPNLTPISI